MKAAKISATRRLAALLDRRWAVPVLAELSRGAAGVSGLGGGGAKFVTLVHRLGVPRETLSRTLETLIRDGWVVRNPGYGHPVRPEYLLSEAGVSLARACADLLAALAPTGGEPLVQRKWSLPVAGAMASGSARFGEIKAMLPGVTSRALAMALKELEAQGLIERRVDDQYPPRPTYALAGRNEELIEALRRLESALAA